MEKEIVREALGTYLRLSAGEKETVGDRIFMYQNIPGFLSMEITWINGQKYYLYDISGKITLGKYLSGCSFDIGDVRSIFRQILDLPEKLQAYLLDEKGAVIHPDYLYLDSRTGEMEAVYYPDSPYQGISAIGELLEYIMDQMDQKDQKLAFFVYGMHRLIKEEETTQQTLKGYLEEKTDKEMSGYVREQKVQGPGDGEQEGKGQRERQEKEKSYLLPAMILSAGLLLATVLWCSGWFLRPVSGETDWPQGIGVTAFFLGVSGYGAWKTWPKTERYMLWEDGEEHKKVCLIPCQGQEAPIPVCRVPFLLGCDRERVDAQLKARDMSPIHARIIQEGDGFMVMDEESAHGTFHNGKRLVPWQKKRIEDGDRLRFADREYVVEIT